MRRRKQIDPYEIRHRIDELFMEDLDTFVQSRERIAHKFGLQVYANVMSHFATGERYLNRSWSASTDGYVDEVHRYLERSKTQFRQALELLQSQQQSRLKRWPGDVRARAEPAPRSSSKIFQRSSSSQTKSSLFMTSS